jgi:hypothetical protein
MSHDSYDYHVEEARRRAEEEQEAQRRAEQEAEHSREARGGA